MTFIIFILRCALKFVFFLQVNLRLFRYLVCWKLFSKCHISAWLLHVFIWRETTSLRSTFYTKNHTFYSHNSSLFSKCLFSVYRQIFSENCKLEIFILFSFKNLYKSKITTYKRPLAFSFMKDSELRIMQCNSFFIGLSLINEHHCIVLNSGSIGHKTARSCIWNSESTTRMHIQFIKY